jgi:signal transduction histidine kinase
MRRLLGVLRAEGDELRLDPQPGLDRIDDLVNQARAAGLDVQVSVEGPQRPLPPGVDLAAYRVIQEALTNVRKHAGTGQAWVHLRYLRDTVEIEVVDNGKGAKTLSDSERVHGQDGQRGGGHGLIGMRERVLLYGGIMAAAPRPEAGFVVQVCLPTESSSW